MKKSKNIPTLVEIKAMVKHETSGGKIMPRFYDFMENNDKYMTSLDICNDDTIHRMISRITQKALQIDNLWATLERAIFLENRADHFIHGQFFMAGRLVSFFYFDDIEIGCMAIAPKEGTRMMYMRFESKPSENRLN